MLLAPYTMAHSPDLNLTPLAAFSRFCWAQRGSDLNVFVIRGWIAGWEMDHIEAWWWKSCTDNKYLYHLWRDWLFIGRSRYSEMFISTYIPTYKGSSLWNSLHNHRYHYGFPLEVRFRHVISCICLDISESGNANSQIGKSKALMRWFSQLISFSLDGFDAKCTDNIVTLLNSITFIFKNVVSTYHSGIVWQAVPQDNTWGNLGFHRKYFEDDCQRNTCAM